MVVQTTTSSPPTTTSTTPPPISTEPTPTTIPTTIEPTITTTPPPPTITTTTSIPQASIPTIPTTSTQPSQPRKQRIRRRRDSEVTQPSGPNVVEDNIVPNEFNDLPSGEDRLQLNELMNLCTTLQAKVLELEKTKASQQLKIESLDRRVKKLEKDKKKRTHKLKRLYKGRRIADIDEDAKVLLVDEVQGRIDEGDEMMFDDDKDLSGEEVVVEKVAEKNTPKAKGVAPKARSISISEPSESHRADIPKKNLDKGKGKMVEPEKPLKRKDQILLDEAEKEAKLVEDWDNVKAKMDTDNELASKLQAEEQEELTIEEKTKQFLELIENRRKHFTAKRVEEKRSKPPTKAQKRKIMSTYLKNIDGWKLHQLKGKSYDEVEKLFGQAMARINNFVGMDSAKEAKKLEAKLQALIEITSDEEEVPMNVIPLATKPPDIVDYGIYKE
ncbi:hypothetical protein Tco_0302985 [Tanacetum coccineum]